MPTFDKGCPSGWQSRCPSAVAMAAHHGGSDIWDACQGGIWNFSIGATVDREVEGH